jgi:LPS-assembly protein
VVFFADSLRTTLFLIVALAAAALPAHAQPAPGGCARWSSDSKESVAISATNHYLLIRDVQVDCNDMQFFADEMEIFSDADRVTARGNVVFVTGDNRIAAERMEFNTRTRTGTFYVASGIASMGNRRIDRSLFGAQEPDAYFWGETIEKLGPKTYRITRGGFTTCVQPTPRWEIVSDSVTLTLEKHAVLKNAILQVKDVPMFYLPVMYYPINKEDRATGFLIPTYGSSTIKGQSLSNAFFWAINRSQDATLFHDWFSKTGQGFGGEYRYVQAPGSSGSMRTYILNEHDTVYRQPNGTETNYAGRQSYQITGSATQKISSRVRATASANYFSSIVAEQRYQQNVYAATNRTRSFAANVASNWSKYNISGTVDRNEVFYSETNSNVAGSAPRITVSRAESPIDKLPLYFSLNGEYVTLTRQDKSGTTVNDRGLSRVDFSPTLRFPFTKWQFLTFNSALSWRDTMWTESLTDAGVQVPEHISRRYFGMQTRMTGPVFQRVFSTPNKAFAQKWKHVIEPSLTISHVTSIDNFNNIVKLEGADYVVGGTTSYNYALANRLYAKKDVAREIMSVTISQSYYTSATASQYDRNYQSSFTNGLKPTNFSPIAVEGHVSPVAGTDATVRAEIDSQVHKVRTVSANGSVGKGWIQETAGWSLRRYIPELPGFNVESQATHFLYSATVIRKPGNSLGGLYTFNYDIRNGQYLQRRYMVFYNSQCCGVNVEYQTFNYSQITASTIGVPHDHRLNISFTLAGVGSFSNLLGAFGGQQGR